jgi:hypothetical protein
MFATLGERGKHQLVLSFMADFANRLSSGKKLTNKTRENTALGARDNKRRRRKRRRKWKGE